MSLKLDGHAQSLGLSNNRKPMNLRVKFGENITEALVQHDYLQPMVVG